VGVVNLLDFALKHRAGFVQASTSEVYGDPLQFPQSEDYKGNVSTLGPRACYDEGKRVAETICLDYHREYNLPVKIVRIFNTYGSRMDFYDGRAVTNFISRALDGKDLVIYGDGSHTRSFMYIGDLIRGIDALVQQPDFTGPVNMGNPNELTIKEFAEKIISLTNSSSQIVYETGATDDPKRRVPDISLAQEKLGWQPEVNLDEGLKKTIEYFRQSPRMDDKILVFATTYHPDAGPAELKISQLTQAMSQTQFYIITTKFRRGLPSYELRNKNEHIHRMGFGFTFDKYLLPLWGAKKALQLHKEHKFNFIWSVMASYAGLAAFVKKIINSNIQHLLLVDTDEVELYKKRPKSFLFKIVHHNADAIFMPAQEADRVYFATDKPVVTSTIPQDIDKFRQHIQAAHTDMYFKKTGKLQRFK
jgi:dTDP-4-dehydrorhamnose reductase